MVKVKALSKIAADDIPFFNIFFKNIRLNFHVNRLLEKLQKINIQINKMSSAAVVVGTLRV